MSEINITSFISVPVVAACFIVGYMIKNMTPIKNKYVPSIVISVGTVASIIIGVINTNDIDAAQILNFIITGAISGLASTGSYEFISHTLKLNGDDENTNEEKPIETENDVEAKQDDETEDTFVDESTNESDETDE